MTGTEGKADGQRPVVILQTDAGGYGGAEIHMVELARRIDRDRFEIRSLVLDGPGAERVRSDLVLCDVPVVSGPTQTRALDARATFGLARALGRVAGSANRRLLHCHLSTPFGPSAVLLAAKTLGLPVVCTEHTYYPASSDLQRRRRSITNHLVDQEIAVSGAVARGLIEELGQRRDKVIVIRNGIDLVPYERSDEHAWKSRRSRMRRQLGMPDDAILVGTVGRQVPEKNHRLLIEAVGRMSGPQTHLVLSGEGDEATRREYQRLAEETGSGQALVLPGRVPDLVGLLTALDIFVLPSRFEGLPLTILESMAAGTPVVATAVGGVPEILTDGVDGILVPVDVSPARLAQVLDGLAEDTALRRLLARQALRTVRRRFDAERMLARTEAEYDYMVSRPPTPRRRGTRNLDRAAVSTRSSRERRSS